MAALKVKDDPMTGVDVTTPDGATLWFGATDDAQEFIASQYPGATVEVSGRCANRWEATDGS